MKIRLWFTTLPAAAALVLGACSKSGDDEKPPPSGPQTGPGKILDAAQKTRDKANEQSRRVREATEKAFEE